MSVDSKNIKSEIVEKYWISSDWITHLLFFAFAFSFCYICWLFISFGISVPSYVDYYIDKREISYNFFDYFYNHFNVSYAILMLLFCFFLAWILKNKKISIRLITGHILFFSSVLNIYNFPLLLFHRWFPYSLFLQILFISFWLIGIKLLLPHLALYSHYSVMRWNSRFNIILLVFTVIFALVFIFYIASQFPEKE